MISQQEGQIAEQEGYIAEQAKDISYKEQMLAGRDHVTETQNARYETTCNRLQIGMAQIGIGAAELWEALKLPGPVGERTISNFSKNNPLFRIAFWESDVDVDYLHTTTGNKSVAVHALYSIRYGISPESSVELLRSDAKTLQMMNMPVAIVSCRLLPKSSVSPDKEGGWNGMTEEEHEGVLKIMEELARQRALENEVAMNRARQRLVSILNLAPEVMCCNLTVSVAE